MNEEQLKGAIYGSTIIIGYFVAGLLGIFILLFIVRYLFIYYEKSSIAKKNQDKLIVILASIIAKMVVVDKKIDEKESIVATKIFDELGYKGINKQIAKDSYLKAFKSDKTIYDYIELLNNFTNDIEIKQYIYANLWIVATSDGKLDEKEKNILKEIPRFLGIASYRYLEYYKIHIGEEDLNINTKSNTLESYYKILNCEVGDDMRKVEKEYRKLVAKFHPSKLIGKGLPDRYIEFEKKRVEKINKAYEEIKKYYK